jgi:hypothetical protein
MVDASIVVALITASSAGIGFFFSSVKDLILYKSEKLKFKKEEEQKWTAARRLAYYEFIHTFSTPYSSGRMLEYVNAALGVMEYGDIKFFDSIPLPTNKIDFLSELITFMLGFRSGVGYTMGPDFEDKMDPQMFDEIIVKTNLALMPILMGILASDDYYINRIKNPSKL